MFIVSLHYTQPLAEIDRLMPKHVAFLEECFRAGVFVAAGRRVPRSGGIIIANLQSKDRLDEIMQLDPFVRESLATYEIVEFRTSLHHPAFAPFADDGTRPVNP